MKRRKAPHYKSGFYYSKKNNKKIKYRSSWELKVFEILEENKDVIKYEYEPFAIYFQYQNERQLRPYLPDLLITYKNKTKKLIEIKPPYKIEKPTLYLKRKLFAGKKYAEHKGWSFEIWKWDKKENKITNITKLLFKE